MTLKFSRVCAVVKVHVCAANCSGSWVIGNFCFLCPRCPRGLHRGASSNHSQAHFSIAVNWSQFLHHMITVMRASPLSLHLIPTTRRCMFRGSEARLRPMAHDPSSPPMFLVPETGASNFSRVPCILVPDFSGTRNLGPVGQCSIRHQKLGCTWPKCSSAIGRWCWPCGVLAVEASRRNWRSHVSGSSFSCLVCKTWTQVSDDHFLVPDTWAENLGRLPST